MRIRTLCNVSAAITALELIMFSPPSCLAEDVSPQKKALAGELITLLRLHESMQVVVRERLKTEELLNPYLSAEEKASRRRAIEKSYDIEAFKAVWAEIYAEIFTEDELKGMIAFFKGPAGGKWIEKQRELEEKTARRMRDFMRDAESSQAATNNESNQSLEPTAAPGA